MLAKSVIELLERQDIDYPAHNSDRVAIGSLVLISLLGDEVGVVVAGAPMVYDEEYLTEKLSKVSEVIVVSTEAPLGSRLLDTAAGQEGFYVTGDEREHHFQVLEVDNVSIEAIYESFI